MKKLWQVLTLASVVAASAWAAGEEFNDLIARIQFDFYSGDVRALQRDLQSLQRLEVSDRDVTTKSYYLAYGHMKLAENLAAKDRSGARKAASECDDYADQVVSREIKRGDTEKPRLETLQAEAWAIKAYCIDIESELSLMPGSTTIGPTLISASRARARASAAAPSNPRVQLLTAIRAVKRSKDEERSKAVQRLQSIAESFDAPTSGRDLPDWGQAEAWAWLGQSYLQLEDRTAARNAIERALVVAPDYAWARTLQSQLNGASLKGVQPK